MLRLKILKKVRTLNSMGLKVFVPIWKPNEKELSGIYSTLCELERDINQIAWRFRRYKMKEVKA